MWAGAWFLSAVLFQLWFPLFSLPNAKVMLCSYYWPSFPKKNPFCLMKVYCGILHANMIAELHLGHPSYVSLSYCVLGREKLASVQKIADLNIKSSPMEKEKPWWENNQNDSSFPFHATCRQGISPPTASTEQVFANQASSYTTHWSDYVQEKHERRNTTMVVKMKYLHQINIWIEF